MNATEKKLSKLAKAVRCESRYGEASVPYENRDEWQKRAHAYRVTLHYRGRQMSLDFFQGEALTDEPDAAGVISCLLSDASGASDSFEDFCENFGYDTDSRKAEKIYQACQKQGEKLKRLLGDDYENFLYAENDI